MNAQIYSGGTAVVLYDTVSSNFSIRERIMWPFQLREIMHSITDPRRTKASPGPIIAVAEANWQNKSMTMGTGRVARNSDKA